MCAKLQDEEVFGLGMWEVEARTVGLSCEF